MLYPFQKRDNLTISLCILHKLQKISPLQRGPRKIWNDLSYTSFGLIWNLLLGLTYMRPDLVTLSLWEIVYRISSCVRSTYYSICKLIQNIFHHLGRSSDKGIKERDWENWLRCLRQCHKIFHLRIFQGLISAHSDPKLFSNLTPNMLPCVLSWNPDTLESLDFAEVDFADDFLAWKYCLKTVCCCCLKLS